MNTSAKTQKRAVRHKRLRSRISGTADKPRLAVFKSNKFVYAQLIDDEAKKTIASADSRTEKGSRLESAKAVGSSIAKKATKEDIKTVVFDRGGFQYKGIIAAVADGAREGGLKL